MRAKNRKTAKKIAQSKNGGSAHRHLRRIVRTGLPPVDPWEPHHDESDDRFDLVGGSFLAHIYKSLMTAGPRTFFAHTAPQSSH